MGTLLEALKFNLSLVELYAEQEENINGGKALTEMLIHNKTLKKLKLNIKLPSAYVTLILTSIVK